MKHTTLPILFTLAVLHSTGCAMEVSDVGASEEELLRYMAPAPLVGVHSPPGDDEIDTSHCYLSRDVCESTECVPTRDPHDLCMTDCFMIFLNCMDSEFGDGGPVEPIW